MEPVIRYLRMRCATPSDPPVHHEDGVLAVAAVQEHAALARLLLVDMSGWGRNTGASVSNVAERVLPEAHRRLIAGFGVTRSETLVAELDRSGNFDLVLQHKGGCSRAPLTVSGCWGGGVVARSREAFVRSAGGHGRAMLDKVDAIRHGGWAGPEG